MLLLSGVADVEELDHGVDIAKATGSLEIDLEGPVIGLGSAERSPELPSFVAYEGAETSQRGISLFESEV
jgi:hypothetical protein